MDPVVRRKIPACIRTLLTDIGPKEEQTWNDWTDTEPETLSRDGIALPKRGSSDSSELLTPAGVKEESGGGNTGDAVSSKRVCGLCLSKPASYTCPRCNIQYCGLACYRSPDHSGCSEEFYKESVFQELKTQGMTEKEGRVKMQEILLRLRQNAEGEGGFENALNEVEGTRGSSGTREDAEGLELLSRLAEIQASGEERGEEVRDILMKLKELGEGSLGDDEDDEEEDLAEKLSGLNIDSLSEEELWALLPSKDKEKFEGLIKGGGAGGLVPLWNPWWERHEKTKETLIEEIEQDGHDEATEKDDVPKDAAVTALRDSETFRNDECREVEEALSHSLKEGAVGNESAGLKRQEKHAAGGEAAIKQTPKKKQKNIKKEAGDRAKGTKSSGGAVPPVSVRIPPLSTLTSRPSPLVKYSLVNALYGYTFSLRLFNGDLSEPEHKQDFCQAVLAISESLGTGQIFNTLHESLEAAVTAVSAQGYFDREDPGAPARAIEAVAHVLSGETRQDPVGYSLAALSQLRETLSKTRGSIPKEEEDRRRKFFLAGKKCEFLQSWVKENSQVVRSLAVGLWREHKRREGERGMLEREKRYFEEGRNKGIGRGNGVLIEERD
ncbi:zinc finger HIT domain-containing protein 2 [Chanos chanos]|uniref:Zinc finger HIT domain-containing protein 2 n=1 Tax=Chanos chanos TaxID=29144 RepID=A0A6J2WVY2_CHACN|nr:zinc finger HIT domain-containing protein 2 [Chanos chanos]